MDSVWLRLAGWKAKHLTLAERFTFIRTTLNAILNHVMQFHNISAGIINTLERCECHFLWGSTQQRKRLLLLKYDQVTQVKSKGGLGIQRLRPKNDSLLATTSWRLF